MPLQPNTRDNEPSSSLLHCRRGRHTQYLLVALNQFRAARHLPLAIFNAFLVAFNKVGHSLADVVKTLQTSEGACGAIQEARARSLRKRIPPPAGHLMLAFGSQDPLRQWRFAQALHRHNFTPQ
jgi:hypothetical protein